MAKDPPTPHDAAIDWESFYANYRKPGYIPGYEIVNKLGAGAFGIVFKARKQSIGKDYAIKFLKVDDEAIRDAVVHELDTVRLFAQIDHPNLVSIEDMGHVDGIPYIVMGYAGEENLGHRLAAGRLTRDEAVRLFIQVARGVQALHARMLVHFDLKPANVYLRDDIARVGDYGLSKLVTASRRSLSFGRGTAYYMAPEVLQRRGDHRSDIYSLGVLLYECLVGEVPFRGETEWEVLKQHETATPRYPSTLLPEDRAVLEACLAKEPEARAQSIDALLEMLLGARSPAIASTAQPAAQQASPYPPSDPPARRVGGAPFAPHSAARRHRRRGFVLLALLVGFGLFIARSQRSREGDARLSVGAHVELARQAALASASRAMGEATRVFEVAPVAPPRPALPATGTLVIDAILQTLRHVDAGRIKGRDPLAEALLEMLKASLEHEDVRRSWREALESVLPRSDAPTRPR